MRAENWLAAADAADLLVVTSTIREDTGYSGLWMLDALQDAGYENLKHKTVTVLSDPSSHVDEQLAHDLEQVYEQRTKSVFRVPYDPVLVAGLGAALRPALRRHPGCVARGLRRYVRVALRRAASGSKPVAALRRKCTLLPSSVPNARFGLSGGLMQTERAV